MGMPNDGAPLPVRSGTRWFPVIAPKAATKVRVTILSETLTGMWTHWDERDFACEGGSKCWRCAAGQGQRWTGYIAAWSWIERGPVVLRLTEGAARQLNALADRHEGARGLTVELRRQYSTKINSRVQVGFVKKETGEVVPPEHPIMDSLARLFGLNDQWYAMRQATNQDAPGTANVSRPLPELARHDPSEIVPIDQQEALRRRLVNDTFYRTGGEI